MYSIFFYFSIYDLPKILDFLDILNKWFEKYFSIKYEWLAWTNTEKFLKIRDWEKKDFIYSVSKINDSWPYNLIKFWDDSFYISTEISWSELWDLQDLEEIEELQKNFSKEMFEKLPLLWVIWIEEECNFHISEFWNQKTIDYSTFIFKKENSGIRFWNWKCNVDWTEKRLF